MKRYIAYFDFLGYKEFIFNNDSDEVRRRAGHILRDIEGALSLQKYQEPRGGVIYADISQSNVNCLNISDTVIFWTNDETIDSLKELLQVAYTFNWMVIQINMPLRGVVCYDEFEMIHGQSKNTVNSIYSTNLIYGKGLANAHLKSENLNWAGSVIDNSIIEKLKLFGVDVGSFVEPYAKLYKIPYKKVEIDNPEEYALNLVKGKLNDQAFKNTKDMILRSFENDNKSTSSPRVQEIIKNTLAFLESYK